MCSLVFLNFNHLQSARIITHPTLRRFNSIIILQNCRHFIIATLPLTFHEHAEHANMHLLLRCSPRVLDTSTVWLHPIRSFVLHWVHSLPLSHARHCVHVYIIFSNVQSQSFAVFFLLACIGIVLSFYRNIRRVSYVHTWTWTTSLLVLHFGLRVPSPWPQAQHFCLL